MRPLLNNTTRDVSRSTGKAPLACRRILSSVTVSLSLILSGCGGGGSDDSDSGSSSGVVSYELIAERSVPSSAAASSTAATVSEKQAVVSGINDIVNIGALVYPALAPVAAITGWINAAFNGASLNNQLNEIFSDINQLQNEVNTLQQELNFLNSDFMQFVLAQTTTDAYAAWTAFLNNSNILVSPSTGAYYIFQSAAAIDPSQQTNYSQLVAQIPTINQKMQGLSQGFVTAINQLSGTELPIDAGGDQIYKSVSPVSDSAVENLYIQMKDYLYVNLPTFPNQSPNGSITKAINQYNSQILYVFQTSTAALQAAYAVDASINQINYHQGLLAPSATATPAYEVETNSSIYYEYSSELSASDNETAYNNAQKQLALVYAARINNLFNLTVQYLISDKPFSDYSYPSMVTGNQSIDKYYENDSYQGIFKSTIPSSKMQSTSTLGQNFPTITTNSNGYIFYIYSAINQFTQCQSAFLQGQKITTANCPSLFGSYYAASTSGVFDGQNLQVWLMGENASKGTLSVQTNLATRCNQEAMSDATWQVSTAFVQANGLAGFSCPAGSLTAVNSATYTPSWTYSASSEDPHNYFYWDAGSNLAITGASGSHVSYGSGSFSIETARVDYNSQFAVSVDADYGGYQGGFVMTMPWSDSGDLFVTGFPIYCPTQDPLCFAYESGICLGGRYLTFTNPNSNHGAINDNGPC